MGRPTWLWVPDFIEGKTIGKIHARNNRELTLFFTNGERFEISWDRDSLLVTPKSNDGKIIQQKK